MSGLRVGSGDEAEDQVLGDALAIQEAELVGTEMSSGRRRPCTRRAAFESYSERGYRAGCISYQNM